MIDPSFLIRHSALGCALALGAVGVCWGQSPHRSATGPSASFDHYSKSFNRYGEPPAAHQSIARHSAATTTPPLPSWQDEQPTAAHTPVEREANVDWPVVQAQAEMPVNSLRSGHVRPASTPHSFVMPAEANQLKPAPDADRRGRRRLAPAKAAARHVDGKSRPLADFSSVLPSFGLPLDSIYTTGSALAIVIGLFLLCAWGLRRGGKKSSAALPEEVVSVLGRVPLAAKQFAQLVRVGNKLVLLSVTTTGVETITEITDPVEIDRLLGLLLARTPNSSTSEFDQVFRELAKETAPAEVREFAPREAASRLATQEAYTAYREGGGRG